MSGAEPPPQVGAEAVRAERAARRAAASPAARASRDDGSGRTIIRSAWIGTAVFTAAAALAVVLPVARIPAVVVDLALFFGGSGLFLWGLVVAAKRSREVDITLWDLILLSGVAPRRARARLLGALTVQILVAAGTCWITAALAFGWLVPLWGLAHAQFWAARYGAFRARRDDGRTTHAGR